MNTSLRHLRLVNQLDLRTQHSEPALRDEHSVPRRGRYPQYAMDFIYAVTESELGVATSLEFEGNMTLK